MLNLATETDIERLRQAALLLEQENARLFRRLERLVAELREARGEQTRSLRLEIAHLKEQLASRVAIYGRSPCGPPGTRTRSPLRATSSPRKLREIR